MASGKITISTTTPGDYQLYWADDKGKPQEIIKINKTKITKIGKSKKIYKKSKKYQMLINMKFSMEQTENLKQQKQKEQKILNTQ